MRTFIATFVLVLGLGAAIPVIDQTTLAPGSATVYAQDASASAQQPQTPVINVEVNRGGRAWYMNPVWMAIGGIALVLIILLIVMAARGGGGGTTVVRG
jgi:hypothetical protein